MVRNSPGLGSWILPKQPGVQNIQQRSQPKQEPQEKQRAVSRTAASSLMPLSISSRGLARRASADMISRSARGCAS